MKRFFAVLLASIILLSLSACSIKTTPAYETPAAGAKTVRYLTIGR